MDRYVVIGNPIAHSLSPEIHAAFAAQTGAALAYDRLLVEPGHFAAEARAFFASGGKGANVTVPFKLEAHELATTCTARAELAGAANLLVHRDGVLAADNTDGAGLVADLEGNAGFALRGKSVLVLGAGGAARGVIAPLLARSVARVSIANRTLEKASTLAGVFSAHGEVHAIAFDALPSHRSDLVVNATSASTRGEALALPPSLFGAGVLAYDMAYGHARGGFLDDARRAGSRTRDGLGMLVEQAAESFLVWRGVRPQTDAVLASLRTRFA